MAAQKIQSQKQELRIAEEKAERAERAHEELQNSRSHAAPPQTLPNLAPGECLRAGELEPIHSLLLVHRETGVATASASEAALGQGSFGKVYRVRHSVDEHDYAVKVVRLDVQQHRHGASFDVSKVKKELLVLTKCNHEHIVRFYDVFELPSPQRLCYRLGLCKGGTLKDEFLEKKLAGVSFASSRVDRLLGQVGREPVQPATARGPPFV